MRRIVISFDSANGVRFLHMLRNVVQNDVNIGFLIKEFGNDKERRKAVYFILLFLDEKKQKSSD